MTPHSYRRMAGILVRVRVRERLSATPGHVIGQGPASGGGLVPCGGGGRGELKKLRVFGLFGQKQGHFLVKKSDVFK